MHSGLCTAPIADTRCCHTAQLPCAGAHARRCRQRSHKRTESSQAVAQPSERLEVERARLPCVQPGLGCASVLGACGLCWHVGCCSRYWRCVVLAWMVSYEVHAPGSTPPASMCLCSEATRCSHWPLHSTLLSCWTAASILSPLPSCSAPRMRQSGSADGHALRCGSQGAESLAGSIYRTSLQLTWLRVQSRRRAVRRRVCVRSSMALPAPELQPLAVGAMQSSSLCSLCRGHCRAARPAAKWPRFNAAGQPIQFSEPKHVCLCLQIF